MDHQVKIRGFRVEPGEIESVLSRHPAVRESVVVARQDAPGDIRLVAYVVAKPATAPNISELRDFLKKQLPDYMVPSAFLPLEKMPLMPNGKLDRRALPAPDQSRPDLERVYAAPGTTTEGALSEIWSEVLEMDQVGIHDNFFELGGHSLMGMQLIARLRSAFDVDVRLATLFEAATVTELALTIEMLLIEEIEKLDDEEVQDLVEGVLNSASSYE